MYLKLQRTLCTPIPPFRLNRLENEFKQDVNLQLLHIIESMFTSNNPDRNILCMVNVVSLEVTLSKLTNSSRAGIPIILSKIRLKIANGSQVGCPFACNFATSLQNIGILTNSLLGAFCNRREHLACFSREWPFLY